MSGIDDLTDENEVPPLEDMSEVLKQEACVNKLIKQQDTVNGKSVKNVVQAVEEVQIDDAKVKHSVNQPVLTTQRSSTTSTSFGGFKKGFLFSKPSKPNAATSSKPAKDEIPIIRPKDPSAAASNKNQIKEVQEAMKANMPLLENKEWITDDLLKKLESNPTLAKKLADPRFSAAIQQLQENPASAEQAMKGDPELQTFVQEFCGLLGDHFTKLGEKEISKPEPGIGLTERSTTSSSGTTAEEKELQGKVETILKSPEIVEILKDQWVQKLMDYLRTDPEKGQHLLRTSSPEQRQKIRVLVDAGLLAPA